MSGVTEQEIIASNLKFIREREAELERLRALEVGELTLPELPSPATMRDISHVWRRITRADGFDAAARTVLCRRMFEEYSGAGIDFAEVLLRGSVSVDEWLLGRDDTPPLVSYVGNPYSDEARRRLYGETSVREHACRSFSELCDDISTGVSDGCMIPIENTSDGKLMSFYSIIDRLELKILRTCDVESSDGDKATRYALLARRACLPCTGDAHYLEFSFSVTDGAVLGSILRAAEAMSLNIYRIDSIGQRYDEAFSTHYLVLHGGSDDLLCFLLYLALELPGYTLIGLYDHV